MAVKTDNILRSVLTGSFISVITIILMFLLLEVLVRVIIPWKNDVLHQCHPLYGITGIPNVTGNFYGMVPESLSVPKVVVHMNSKGLRDREYEYEKLDSFRILILGDSMIAALQVPLEQTAQEVVERFLNSKSMAKKNIEIIAGAQPGWGTDDEYLFYLEEGYKYQPDLVLLAFHAENDVRNNSHDLQIALNDHADNPYFVLGDDNTLILKDFPFPCDNPSGKTDGNPHQLQTRETIKMLPSVKKWMNKHSCLYRFVKGRIHRMLSQNIVNILEAKGVLSLQRYDDVSRRQFEIAHGIFFTKLPSSLQTAWSLTEKLILALRNEVVRNGSTFAVIKMPSQFEVVDLEWQRVQKEASRFGITDIDRNKPSEMVTKLCTQYGIPFLNTFSDFLKQANNDKYPLYFKGDGHLTKAGNYLLANLLVSWLKENNLLMETREETLLPFTLIDASSKRE